MLAFIIKYSLKQSTAGSKQEGLGFDFEVEPKIPEWSYCVMSLSSYRFVSTPKDLAGMML